MFNIIKSVIDSKDFKLEDILYKINKMYIEDRISEEEKSELDNLARSKAKAENSYDIQKQLDNIFARLEALENKDTAEDTTDTAEDTTETAEEYAEFIQPTGAHDSYTNGDKITYNGKKYVCIIPSCVWSPDAYPQGWEEIVENTNEVAEV